MHKFAFHKTNASYAFDTMYEYDIDGQPYFSISSISDFNKYTITSLCKEFAKGRWKAQAECTVKGENVIVCR